jgi:CelD/BcsL family acetyltransferase involved in cellulose biosynthesis
MITRAAVANHNLVLYTPDELQSDPNVRASWESLVRLANPMNRPYAGPAWFENHARNQPHEGNRVALLKDGDGQVVGICPVVHWNLSVPFQVRKYVLGKIKLQAATVLSGEPMLPQEPALFQMLVDGLLREMTWCDCLYFHSIPADCFTSRLVYSGEANLERVVVHPKRLQRNQWLYHELEESFEKYVRSQSSRARTNCKRRFKRLNEFAKGALECERIETEDQVDAFQEAARSVAEKSWQHGALGMAIEETALHRETLLSFARSGILRAYLLKCGGRACAFWIGLQYQDTLLSEQQAFSSELSAYSPGIVLLYLLLQDVYKFRRPKYLHFGDGVNPAKRLFANRSTFDSDIYLLRPTLGNRLFATSHGLFYAALDVARRRLVKRAGVGDENGEIDQT